MLPPLNLQMNLPEAPIELRHTASLLPDEAASPQAVFADFLSPIRNVELFVDGAAGDALPAPGNVLPLTATPAGAVALPPGAVGEPPAAGDSNPALAGPALRPQAISPPGAIGAQPENPAKAASIVPGSGASLVETPTDAAVDARLVHVGRQAVSDDARWRAAEPALPDGGGPIRQVAAPMDSLHRGADAPLSVLSAVARTASGTPPAAGHRRLSNAATLIKTDAGGAGARPSEPARQSDAQIVPMPRAEKTSAPTDAGKLLFQADAPSDRGAESSQAPGTGASAAARALAPEAAHAAARTGRTIDLPVQDAAWGERLSERVVVMAGSRLQNAEIRLTPSELGPIRVQVNVEDGTANVTFHAQHAVTRDAIEQALPRLRELLAENGLALGNADVGDRGIAQGQREQNVYQGSAAQDDGEAPPQEPGHDTQAGRASVVPGDGRVDTFA